MFTSISLLFTYFHWSWSNQTLQYLNLLCMRPGTRPSCLFQITPARDPNFSLFSKVFSNQGREGRCPLVLVYQVFDKTFKNIFLAIFSSCQNLFKNFISSTTVSVAPLVFEKVFEKNTPWGFVLTLVERFRHQNWRGEFSCERAPRAAVGHF